MDFKEQWRVLVGLLGEGAGAADMFCRILVAVDEDVISLDIPRSQDGVRASMELKVLPMRLPGVIMESIIAVSQISPHMCMEAI